MTIRNTGYFIKALDYFERDVYRLRFDRTVFKELRLLYGTNKAPQKNRLGTLLTRFQQSGLKKSLYGQPLFLLHLYKYSQAKFNARKVVLL